MRKLAMAAFSFGAAILLSQYILPDALQLYFAVGFFIIGAFAFLLKGDRRLRAMLIVFGAAVGFLWNWGYHALIAAPAENMDGVCKTVSATVNDFPTETEYGYSVDLKLHADNKTKIRTAAFFDDEAAGKLRPGDEITFYAELYSASSVNDKETNYYTAKGYFLRAKKTASLETVSSPGFEFRYIHRWLSKAIKDKVSELYPADSVGFMQALMTGDKLIISKDAETVGALKRTGIYHIIVVSGMHVSVLSGFIMLLAGKKRRAFFITLPILILFAGVSGFSPSVVRAVIMQIFLLLAPLLDRESDGVTSLSAAMVFILLCNPYAIAGVSFQLSFAASLGIILFSPKLNAFFGKAFKAGKKGRIYRFFRNLIAGGLASTVSASVLTMPLIALYFGYVSIISPLVNLLILWAVTPLFCAGISAVAAGFIFAPVGKVIAWVSAWLVRYIVWIVKTMSEGFFASVYLDNILLVCWFVFVYLMIVLFIVLKAEPRQLISPSCVAVIALCAILLWNAWSSPRDTGGGGFSAAVLDVGQGQCIVFSGGGYTAVVDCGSSSGEKAGETAARYLYDMGVNRIDLFVLTHYHSDHANGVEELMAYADVSALAAPEYDEEDGKMGERIEALAEKEKTDIIYVTEDTSVTMGDMSFTLFAPMGAGSENERGVCVLASSGDYDVLITGDIDSTLERRLISHASLPDIECLVVGHHGSKYSTSEALLDEVTPEIAVISVGENSYGHPTEEALERLSEADAEIFRTDEAGNIIFSISGE